MNKEIEIPYGYEARIEGNKVIFELKESVDEKIRKYIVSFVELNKGVNLPPDEADKILAYLEKQKEQKPAEWSEEDEENFKWFDKFFRAEATLLGGRDIPQDKYLWFKSLRSQPKQEWSEEDELMRNEIVTRIEYCARYENELSKAYSQQEINWLKSLPERFALQPEQERQIKEGDKVSIHCRKDRKNTFFYDGKVGEVIHVWDAERNPWGHIVVRLDNGCNDGFHEDELEVLDEPTNRY